LTWRASRSSRPSSTSSTTRTPLLLSVGSKTLSEEYRKGYARISENMFASYKTFYRLVVEWLSENKWEALLLSQCNLQVVQHFFST
jgi:hypothetical protein